MVVAYSLGQQNKRALIGEAFREAAQAAIRQTIVESPGIDSLVELLTMRMSPEEVLVAARVDLDDTSTVDELEKTPRRSSVGCARRTPRSGTCSSTRPTTRTRPDGEVVSGRERGLAVARQQLARLLLVAVRDRHQQLGDDVGELGDPAVEPTVLVDRGRRGPDPVGYGGRLAQELLAGSSCSSWFSSLLGEAGGRRPGVPADLEPGDMGVWLVEEVVSGSDLAVDDPATGGGDLAHELPVLIRLTRPRGCRAPEAGSRSGVLQEQRAASAQGHGAQPPQVRARLGVQAADQPPGVEVRRVRLARQLCTGQQGRAQVVERQRAYVGVLDAAALSRALVWRSAAPEKSKATTRWPWR